MLPATPTKLGRYEIVDEIGKGAMGVVYLARDPLIGRLVALKTFRIGYSVKDQELEQFRIRFMREAQSAGILTHPHIVTIHDVVEKSEEGLAFIAMEYVRGTNLKLLLQNEQPLSLAFVVDTIAQVGEALDYAHASKVVHRDVKPANILITAENRVKITDFGIARLESSNLTMEGQLLGTPNYMAPEQIQGREVDHRADLFSLGVVLYEMLTRHKPFQGENLTVVSHRIVYDHFTPPRDYIRDLPPGLEGVLVKALEKEPGKRYQKARELIEDLRKVVNATQTRDDLNQTQNLSSTMVLPPPPPPPPKAPAPAKTPLFSRWRRGARPAPPLPPPAEPGTTSSGGSPPPPLPADPGTSSSASVPPPPLPPAAPGTSASASVPPPPDVLSDTVATGVSPPPAPRSSPRRLLAAAGIAAVLGVLVIAGFLLWRRQALPDMPDRDAGQDARQARIVQLVSLGQERRAMGDWAGATAAFREAEQLDPQSPSLRRLREHTESTARTMEGKDGLARTIAFSIETAKQALASRQYAAAAAAAESALLLDPANAEAKDLLAKAKQSQARGTRKPTVPSAEASPGEQVAATPSATETPAGDVSEPAAPAPTTATLTVHFQSYFPSGVLIVSVNEERRVNHPFGGRGGILPRFRREKNEGQPHVYNVSMSVPAGTSKLRIHVAPSGQGAKVKNLSGSFPGGSSRTLELYVSSSGELSEPVLR